MVNVLCLDPPACAIPVLWQSSVADYTSALPKSLMPCSMNGNPFLRCSDTVTYSWIHQICLTQLHKCIPWLNNVDHCSEIYFMNTSPVMHILDFDWSCSPCHLRPMSPGLESVTHPYWSWLLERNSIWTSNRNCLCPFQWYSSLLVSLLLIFTSISHFKWKRLMFLWKNHKWSRN